MLTSSFQESQNPYVSVRDTTPAAFKAVLHYAYTNILLCDVQSVLDIMRKAREVRACNDVSAPACILSPAFSLASAVLEPERAPAAASTPHPCILLA